jgi:hypothetical protein
LTGLAARADSDTTFSYRWNSGTPIGYLSVFVRGSGGWRNGYRPTNGYGLELASNSSSVTITKTVAGTTTSLNATSGAQQVGSGRQWWRLRVSGSTIQYKTWMDGQVEPSTWRASVTDTSVTAAGQFFVSLNRGRPTPGRSPCSSTTCRCAEPGGQVWRPTRRLLSVIDQGKSADINCYLKSPRHPGVEILLHPD